MSDRGDVLQQGLAAFDLAGKPCLQLVLMLGSCEPLEPLGGPGVGRALITYTNPHPGARLLAIVASRSTLISRNRVGARPHMELT